MCVKSDPALAKTVAHQLLHAYWGEARDIGDADLTAAIPDCVAINDAVRGPAAFAQAERRFFGIARRCRLRRIG
jgi:hypothetical protein